MIHEGQHNYIVAMFCDKLTPVKDIAFIFNVTRQAIYDVLHKAGVDTSKGQRIEKACSWCGRAVFLVRSRVRGRKRFFCDIDCSTSYAKVDKKTHPVSRSVVGQWFEMKNGMVAHYEDGKWLNNAKDNLKVFRNQASHIRWHYDGSVEPIWDGKC